MKKRKSFSSPQPFSELEKMVNPEHPLYQLSQHIPWSDFESEFASLYSSQGRPAAPVRLMVSLLILKHLHDLGDETVLQAWVENPYFQYFSGMKEFHWRVPIHPTDLGKFRQRIGEGGIEKILEISIQIHGKLSEEPEVVLDTTVQEKQVTFPTDTKLYRRVVEYCWRIANSEQVLLRQSYRRTLKPLLLAQRNRQHPKNKKKAIKATQKLKTIAGRLVRELERKLTPSVLKSYENLFDIFHRVLTQKRSDSHKIYSLHEPQIYCMAKGKDHVQYEFGTKVSIVMTKLSGIIVGALSFPENRYDGKTLPDALTQTAALLGKLPETAIADRGYQGQSKNENIEVLLPKAPSKKTTGAEKKKARKRFRRRTAIEPVIGHLKEHFRLSRNYYRGTFGDQINVMLAAAAYNFKKWMRHQMQALMIKEPALNPLIGAW